MAARHPDVAAGPAAGGFLPVPVGTEPDESTSCPMPHPAIT
jgi:hypothetical protein